jgi:hypothetical protein
MRQELKFYASQGFYKHKLFTFQVSDIAGCGRILSKFRANKAIIHRAYWLTYDKNGKGTDYELNLFFYWCSGLLLPFLAQFKPEYRKGNIDFHNTHRLSLDEKLTRLCPSVKGSN